MASPHHSLLLTLTLSLTLSSITAPSARAAQLPHHPLARSGTSGTGLTFDACDASRPCAPGRACIAADSYFLCTFGKRCICFPPRIKLCSRSSECVPGERCASRPPDRPFCLSAAVFAADPTFIEAGQPSILPASPLPTRPPPTRPPPVVTEPERSPFPSPRPSASASVSAPATTRPPARSPSPSASLPAPRPSASLPSPRPSAPPGGLAGDPCRSNDDCLKHRACRNPDSLSLCREESNCLCLGSTKCVCNDDCLDGEVCSGAPGKGLCFSPRYIDSLPWANSLPCASQRPQPTDLPASPSPIPSSISGLSGERCTRNEECFGERLCIAGEGSGCVAGSLLCQEPFSGCTSAVASDVCYCFAEKICRCSDDCMDTELCTEVTRGRVICASRTVIDAVVSLSEVKCSSSEGDDDTTGGNGSDVFIEATPAPPGIGVEEVTDTPRPGEDDDTGERPDPTSERGDDQNSEGDVTDVVCIDAAALQEFAAEDLVYPKHATSRVLCDAQGSCATPGHMVVYLGSAMMMKRYCTLVHCEKRIMKVNSPKLQTGLRVSSKTEDLEYTAFAARYETRAEELILSTAVHIGM